MNSPIALVALIVFRGLFATPCLSAPNPYRDLDKYLTQNAPTDRLEDNVEAVSLIFSEANIYEAYDGYFLNLADIFRILKDDPDKADPELCSKRGIESLRFLIDMAQRHDERFMKRPGKAMQLDRLLINLTKSVHSNCYRYLHSKWNSIQGRNLFLDILDVSGSIKRISSDLPPQVLKRFIYHPKDTTKATTSKDNLILVELIRDALLALRDLQNRPLIWPKIDHSTVKLYLEQYFTIPCQNFMNSPGGEGVLRLVFNVAEMHLIVLPYIEFIYDPGQTNYKIDYMPAYVVCCKIVKNHEKLINSLHKLLLTSAKERQMSH